jgi:hypothetical protein
MISLSGVIARDRIGFCPYVDIKRNGYWMRDILTLQHFLRVISS